eukprot:3731417-Rhodomonas_salina.1
MRAWPGCTLPRSRAAPRDAGLTWRWAGWGAGVLARQSAVGVLRLRGQRVLHAWTSPRGTTHPHPPSQPQLPPVCAGPTRGVRGAGVQGVRGGGDLRAREAEASLQEVCGRHAQRVRAREAAAALPAVRGVGLLPARAAEVAVPRVLGAAGLRARAAQGELPGLPRAPEAHWHAPPAAEAPRT